MSDIRVQQLETLEMAVEYIGNLEKGILECSECFQGSKEDKGYELVTQIIDGLNWLIEAIRLTNPLHTKKIVIEKIEESFCEMIEGLENRDIVLITDILQYEILELIKGWKEQMQETLDSNGNND